MLASCVKACQRLLPSLLSGGDTALFCLPRSSVVLTRTISHTSTSGGTSLELLEGKALPELLLAHPTRNKYILIYEWIYKRDVIPLSRVLMKYQSVICYGLKCVTELIDCWILVQVWSRAHPDLIYLSVWKITFFTVLFKILKLHFDWFNHYNSIWHSKN